MVCSDERFSGLPARQPRAFFFLSYVVRSVVLCLQPPLLARLLLEFQFGLAAAPVVDLPLDARLDFTPG